MKAFEIRVVITVDEEGGAQSSFHDLASEQDREVLTSLPGGGIHQMAFALLLEGVRREMFLEATIKQGGDSSFIPAWKKADEEGKRKLEEQMVKDFAGFFAGFQKKIVPGVAREILEMLAGAVDEKG